MSLDTVSLPPSLPQSCVQARSALVHLEAAVASDETYAEAWTYLGCAHKELEQMDQSLEAFGRALAIDPANAKANYHAAR